VALVPERLAGRERGWLWAALAGLVCADRHERRTRAGAPGRRRALAAATSAAARSVPDIERRNRELEALYAAAVTMA
jgi:hypothetical protein